MTNARRNSYIMMAALLVLIGVFHLGALVLTAFFGYFALEKFSFGCSRILGVAIYVVVVVGIGCGLFVFSHRAYKAIPEIADRTIPAVVEFAERKGIELPFSDYASLKEVALAEVKDKVANVGRYAREAVFQAALVIIGIIVAASLFLNARWGADPQSSGDTVYANFVRELSARFGTFYKSFGRVMGAQIIISFINTALTAVFLAWNGFPYIFVIVGLTFLFGLLPIVGNLMGNTLVVGVAFTMPDGPRMALFALIFLIVIHKLEYFLNSKIIGDRIKNPMWLTLIGLVVGEKLMGIPGMVLAPIVLHYIKVEASQDKIAVPIPVVVAPPTPAAK
ncbi:MAG TPA: AI-2E family transporter [Verrucomicrobiae bacterium]|nr:AI-2E family transporter [Verrucomicrobiae bacterium]